jgi:hypothetical protein
VESPHACRWETRLTWGPWRTEGALRVREGRRVAICATCGIPRPRRVPARVALLEVEAATNESAPLADATGRKIVAEMIRRAAVFAPPAGASGDEVVWIPARGLLNSPTLRGFPGTFLEEWIDRLVACGWLAKRTGGGARRALRAVAIRAPDALHEFAWPGERGARETALSEARRAIASLSHPVAGDVARILAEEDATLDPALIRALVSLAGHAEAGEVLAERVFSVRWLGDSKALGRLRRTIEQRLGPLEALGIREGVAFTLLGGAGGARVRGESVDLGLVGPMVGFSREALLELDAVECPGGGLLVVENLTAFEACCHAEVAGAEGALVVWSAGYPGRGVRAVVERAAAAGARIRVWADLDLDGVRIARMIASWAPGSCGFFRMSPDDVRAASTTRALPPRARSAIAADLAARPDAPLADTLALLHDSGRWVEQEVFLGGSRTDRGERDRD